MAAFEWDHDKNTRNIAKHGIDFTTASLIWRGPIYERVDDRRVYGETRLQAFGLVEDRVLTVVFTWRGAVRRLISARRANFREKTFFETEISRSRSPPD
ncbi:MAG: BrnT family toxin [Stellaceae bacterium]